MASGIEQCCAANGNCFPFLRDRLEDAVSTAAKAAHYMLTSWLRRLLILSMYQQMSERM